MMVFRQSDQFPFDAQEVIDHDLDGIGDVTDVDDDNDGVIDTLDAFLFDAAEPVDTDADGIGNNTDLDDDNDGVIELRHVTRQFRIFGHGPGWYR